ncbi:MAG: thioredoxin domain-containing protein [Acidimicrobiia bacterium]|nr:thioredoxin domain-containing protein [Acidimicrobiia bacterium]MYC57001.1 thioredoxin domain-containing protein [Acidimicrobiia bacterium]MYI30866.1 thioredoxin domain-containing protein [Acidimicrobiia bacterium]
MNRLGDETSPYLRQHANNPVNWYPWGKEAFAAANASDKPILLSVGYSACHWCHVMAHESFEDPATAELMNKLFINIKVDREERPDVDTIYMQAVQSFSGRGGWPMTVFMTPDGRPFYGGTYYPKVSHPQMPSFTEIMHRIQDVWANRRTDVYTQADAITQSLHHAAQDNPTHLSRLSPNLGETAKQTNGAQDMAAAASALRKQYDAAWGGFGSAPKFPQTMCHEVLLRCYLHNGDQDVLNMTINSLDAMASGGIYDHLGGGFSRYAVDAQWIIPHFEKMLYDNALLTRLYLHAWQITQHPRFRQVTNETVSFVLHDLRHPDGGFYSALDADSEGEEGKFYLWTPHQIVSVLGDNAAEFMAWYGVTDDGNFEGQNILWRPVRGDLLRSDSISKSRERLLEARNQRIWPGLDDKVLLEWNGLMLSALAEAAAATGNQQWLEAAVQNGLFLLDQMRRNDGRWLRSWQAGDTTRPAQARHLAYAADYAAVTDAFTRLGEVSGQSHWIHEATLVADGLLELFWDDTHGGVFTTGHDAEKLICRPKELIDNAMPSANSAAAVALLRLGTLTGRQHYLDRAQDILALLDDTAVLHPNGFGRWLEARDMSLSGITEIVIGGDRPDLRKALWCKHRPNTVLAWGEPYNSPLWEGRTESLGYVCRNYTCQTPANTITEFLANLDEVPQN